jgi:hypothetical protein
MLSSLRAMLEQQIWSPKLPRQGCGKLRAALGRGSVFASDATTLGRIFCVPRPPRLNKTWNVICNHLERSSQILLRLPRRGCSSVDGDRSWRGRQASKGKVGKLDIARAASTKSTRQGPAGGTGTRSARSVSSCVSDAFEHPARHERAGFPSAPQIRLGQSRVVLRRSLGA